MPIPQLRHGEAFVIIASRQMPLNATFPSEPAGWVQVTNLNPNSTAIVDVIVLCLDGFPRRLCIVKFDECKGRALLHGYQMCQRVRFRMRKMEEVVTHSDE